MSADPWTVLGLEPGAGAEAIAAAHRAQRAAHEGDAAALARIDEAFTTLSDPRARARIRLFGPAPFVRMTEVQEVLRTLPRQPAGASLWLAALREGGPTGRAEST
ncbi:MAG TPA: hypothetical protein VK081_08740 [Planctomycetota bacterium]|nr:hypothetical protein [Planctomycetota bacterium]